MPAMFLVMSIGMSDSHTYKEINGKSVIGDECRNRIKHITLMINNNFLISAHSSPGFSAHPDSKKGPTEAG